MKLFKSTLGFFALAAVVFFSACSGGGGGKKTPDPLTVLEILAGLQGEGGITWVATSVTEDGTTVSADGDGFEIKLTYKSELSADYSISQGTLSDVYWPNYNVAPTTTGDVTLEGLTSDNVTFDASSANASSCTFGGVTPTEDGFRLEWTNTNDKTTPNYVMVLVPKN